MKKMLVFALTIAVLGLMVPAAFAADLTADANYKGKCAACHGANAEGKPAMKTAPMKDSAAKSADELTTTITNNSSATVTVTSIVVPAGYTVSATTCTTLVGGANCQLRITFTSTPDCNRCIAVVCRITCGVIRHFFGPGVPALARAA